MKNTFFLLTYFKNSSTICADDFKEQQKQTLINVEYIVSICSLQVFKKPFSGEKVEEYSFITMINNDRYAIKAESYHLLMNILQDFLL